MTWVVERGHAYERVIWMDLLSFRDLHDSCTRLDAAEKQEQAWTAMIAAQGQKDAMDSWLERFQKILKPEAEKKNDATEFLQALKGRGF